MTKDQKLYKGLILADLKIVESFYDNSDKALKLQAAYHMQQAVEKTIKLKAEIKGVNLWGHNINKLIKSCDDNAVDIGIPRYIKENAIKISSWETEGRYYPIKVVRKDSIKKVYDVTLEWLETGDTCK